MSWFHWIILIFSICQVQTEITGCDRSVLQVVSVFDITVSNIEQFREQQARLIETLRHINTVTKGRQKSYSLIVYHKSPVVLASLGDSSARNLNEAIEKIENLNPRNQQEKSAVIALQAALEQIKNNSQPGVKTIIILSNHDDNLDSLSDIVKMKSRLESVNASVFVLSDEYSTLERSLHFASNKERIYMHSSDLPVFFSSIDSNINACLEDVQPNGIPTHNAFGVKNTQPECPPSHQVDLMIVLDTSGSIQRTFERERNLALELVNNLNKKSFAHSLQTAVIQFSAEPTLVVGFRHRASKQKILDRLRSINFTGRITRIAKAVEIGLKELDENGNQNSTRIFVLITDGSSLDYWSDVKKTGLALRRSGASVFVASTSSEINFDEMLIYSGDSRNIFIGARDKLFPIAVSSLIQKCLNATNGNLYNDTEVQNDLFPHPNKADVEKLLLKNDHGKLKEPTGTMVANDAKKQVGARIERPEKFFTRVSKGSNDPMLKDPKNPLLKDPKNPKLKKYLDGKANNSRDTFNELSGDEILANTTEIDENEFEGSGQETKADDSLIELISTVSQKQTAVKELIDERPSCKFDLVFFVESSTSDDLRNHLNVVRRIVDGLPDVLTLDKMNISLLVNGKTIQPHGSKTVFLKTIQNIQHVKALSRNSSQFIEEFKSFKRSNSHRQLLCLFLLSGKSAHAAAAYLESIIQELKPSHSLLLSNTDSSPSPLKASKDHLRTFVDPDELKQQTINILLPCVSTFAEQTKFNGSVIAGARCENDPIELFIVLSGVQTDETNLKAKIRLITNLTAIDSQERIRTTIALYTNEGAKLAIPLIHQGRNLLPVIEQLERNDTLTTNLSLVTGLKLALADILPSKRPRARIVGVLIVDETPVDKPEAVSDIYQTLKGAQATVNVLALNRDSSVLQYVGGDSSKIYSQPEKFLEGVHKNLLNCQNETVVGLKIEDADVFDEKTSDLFRRSHNAIQRAESSPCAEAADIILVVDTSTSVEREFNRQLQLASDLIKHIPDSAIETGKISVGIASFYIQAEEVLPLGSLRQKSAILDKIFSIKHSGGSTLISNGLKLAIEMVKRRDEIRRDAQLAIILISDGNSQDNWRAVLNTAAELRLLSADLYALTASQEFSLRELEVYADKNVFTDAQFDEFLKEIDTTILTGCEPSSPSVVREHTTTIAPLPTSTTLLTPIEKECADDLIDLMVVLDTSASTSSQFYSQKGLILDLVKVLPIDGKGRIQTSVVQFNSTSKICLGFSPDQTQAEVMKTIQQIAYTGGNTSLVVGINRAVDEINAHSRQGRARTVILLVSAGNSPDGWTQIQQTSRRLRQLKNADVYAVTFSNAYYFDELREYTADEKNIFADERVDNFIQDLGQVFFSCDRGTTQSPESATSTKLIVSQNRDTNFAARDEPSLSPSLNKEECNFAKIDLILILDASTSRESVFEHQKELALSLIERLPISRGDTHVSIGLNSFIHVPTMRLTLGLGRDRAMVRKAIEEIEFKGGSTLTSRAIDLAIKDLEKGRRPDAIQIIVLLNDGMSQDPWSTVEDTSKRLFATNAELFGVAFGDNVDLRELQLYIRRKERIYRDGAAETERFLQDVVSLLRNDTSGNCPLFFNDVTTENDEQGTPLVEKVEQICSKPMLDIVALLDNKQLDDTANEGIKLNANKYLLLDALGSLPLGAQIHVSVFSFSHYARLEFDLTSEEEKEILFEKVEEIKPRKGRPSYATAIKEALEYYKRNRRSNAKGLLLIIGDGKNSTDTPEERNLAANQIRQTSALLCKAADSGRDVELQTLSAYTGSVANVFTYDRNDEFVKSVHELTTATNDDCKTIRSKELPGIREPILSRDIASPVVDTFNKNVFPDEKVLKKETYKTAFFTTTKLVEIETLAPTTTTINPSTTTTINPSTTTTINPSTTKAPKTDKLLKSTSIIKFPRLTNMTSNCLVDLMLIIDVSGSVNKVLERAKSIASKIIKGMDIGQNTTHVSIIKFASKPKTIHSFSDRQDKEVILDKLVGVELHNGTTAIHSGLLQAVSEYTAAKKTRLTAAQPLAIVFTDGFGQKDISVEAESLREIAAVYSVSINHEFPINRKGLEELTGDPQRAFTDANVDDLYLLLKNRLSNCNNTF